MAVQEATDDKIQLRPGYGYDEDDRICFGKKRDVLAERYDKFPKVSSHLAAVRLEKSNGRRIWVAKDALLAIARRGWPKSECFVCGENIPYLWQPDLRKWVPNRRIEAEHAVVTDTLPVNRHGRVVGPRGGFLCYEQLIGEAPPNDGRAPRRSFINDFIDDIDSESFQVKDLSKENTCGD